MYETLWLAWFGIAWLLTAVSVSRRPDAEVRVASSLLSIIVWFVVGNAATNVQVTVGDTLETLSNAPTAYLAYLLGIVGIGTLLVAIYDWYAQAQTGRHQPEDTGRPRSRRS